MICRIHPRADRVGGAHPRLMLTFHSGDLARAQAAIWQAPETRAERVAALRARIASGSYYIPSRLLAQRLLAHRT